MSVSKLLLNIRLYCSNNNSKQETQRINHQMIKMEMTGFKTFMILTEHNAYTSPKLLAYS